MPETEPRPEPRRLDMLDLWLFLALVILIIAGPVIVINNFID
jgi:hypothetical protein